jgi:uncharacterized protein YcnI
MKKIIILVLGILGFATCVASASAHVVVRPKEVGVAAFQTFTVGVPNEKDIPTVAVRLIIPEGLKHVSPNVKPGWTIDVKKEGEGEQVVVTEISWTGGSIPQEMRDAFDFSAQAPAEKTEIAWKAYQTYSDGTVVAWDQEPSEAEGSTPYSTTTVVDDLEESAVAESEKESEMIGPFKKDNLPLAISVFALGLSLSSFYLQAQKNKKK